MTQHDRYVQRAKMNELLRKDQEYTWLGLVAMGITVNEIAAAYEVSVATVYATIRAGRKHVATAISPSLVRRLGERLRQLPIQARENLIAPSKCARYETAMHCLRSIETNAAKGKQTERVMDLIERDKFGRTKVKDAVEITKIYQHYNPPATDEEFKVREATEIAELRQEEEKFLKLLSPEDRRIYTQAKAEAHTQHVALEA